MAEVPTEKVGYIEILVITVKPLHYRNIDLKTLIPLVLHTYHPEKTELNIVHSQDLIQTNTFFEMHNTDCCKKQLIDKTICEVQPSPNSVA